MDRQGGIPHEASPPRAGSHMDPMTDADLARLQVRLEWCQRHEVERTLTESMVWEVLSEAEHLLERSTGTQYEPTVSFIYQMLAQVWSLHHATERLRRSG